MFSLQTSSPSRGEPCQQPAFPWVLQPPLQPGWRVIRLTATNKGQGLNSATHLIDTPTLPRYEQTWKWMSHVNAGNPTAFQQPALWQTSAFIFFEQFFIKWSHVNDPIWQETNVGKHDNKERENWHLWNSYMEMGVWYLSTHFTSGSCMVPS